MKLCTNLQSRVLDLEKTKTTQANEFASLKRRVKKLEKKRSSRSHKLKRLYKVSLSARVESSGDEEDLGEDAFKQERRINAINADKDITLEVFVAEQEVANEKDDDGEITLAQALIEMKSIKPKVKGIVFQEPGESTTKTATIPTLRKGIVITKLGTPTITRSLQQLSQAEVQDKGKGKMLEPEHVKPTKKDVQIMLDEKAAKKLQAEFDEEERLEKEKDEANITLTEE
ncbi:hypothetical protein Tco_0714916 [Tanacetum coccineum]